MSTTFASRLSSATGRELRLAIVIQGIPFVFQQGRTSLIDAVVGLAGFGGVVGMKHTRHFGLGKVEQAAKELDMQKRRMIGGGLTVELIDDSANALRALFTPRKRRVAFLSGDATAAALAMDVTDVLAQIPDPGAVAALYVGGETITYDGRTAPTTINIAERGAFGSEAAVHFGGSEQGEGVFTTPPSWIGRRVKLIGYFEKDDGTTTASLAQVLDTYRLEEAPKYLGNGSWQMQCSHLSDEFAVRKVGSGINDFNGSAPVVSGNLALKSLALQRWIQGTLKTQALVESDGGDVEIYNITSATSLTATTDGVFGRIQPSAVTLPLQPKRFRHIAVLDASNTTPGQKILQMLTSKVGDGTNGAYDVLGGFNRTRFGGFEFHFGAGINLSDISDTSFLDVGGAGGWSNVIDGERSVEDVLFDFCLQLECFWYVDSTGRLTVKRLAEDQSIAPTTVNNDTIIGEPEVTYDEEAIAPRISLKCNYDPVSGEFEGTVNVVDVDLAARYPSATDTLELESRSVVVDPVAVGDSGTLPRPSIGLAGVEVALRRMQVSNGRGRALVRFSAHLDLMTLDLGQIVQLTAAVPNFESGDVAQAGRVVSVGPRIDEGEVDVVVELLDRAFVIAPACVIASRAGAVLTLQTTGPECASTSPANMFGVGNFVAHWDVSASLLEVNEIIARPAGNQITLAAAPTFAHGTGDFITVTQQGTSDIAANTTGQVPLDFTYQMPDVPVVGSTVDVETRWR